MPSAVEECREPSGNVREFHIVWRVVTLSVIPRLARTRGPGALEPSSSGLSQI